jgi:hypothetical protein
MSPESRSGVSFQNIMPGLHIRNGRSPKKSVYERNIPSSKPYRVKSQGFGKLFCLVIRGDVLSDSLKVETFLNR